MSESNRFMGFIDISVLENAEEFVSAILEKRGEMNDAAYPAGLQALPLLKQIRAALGKVEGEGK
jgi:hypothetical protein